MKTSLSARLLQSFAKHSDHMALELGNQKFTYSQIYEESCSVASAIDAMASGDLVAVYAEKTLPLYLGILGTLFSGRGYMPLRPDFPSERNECIIEKSGIDTIIYDSSEESKVASLRKKFPDIQFKAIGEFRNIEGYTPLRTRQADSLCYLLFTSGSTGEPKGVGITEANLSSYLDFILKTYPLKTTDRCSQAFASSFDLSVHDLFVTWSAGACLVPLANADLYFPTLFIQKKKLSVWFSVPSMAMMAEKMGTLNSKNLKSLRLSFFCGEALPKTTALSWLTASESQVINLYGPTEATIAIMDYPCKFPDLNQISDPVTPIGNVFHGHEARIWNSKYKRWARSEESGELLLSGPQVAGGYWQDSQKSESVFCDIDNQHWYRTGDLVRCDQGLFYFQGRLDDQVQIQGHRVEVGEIEAKLAKLFGHSMIVILPLPFFDANPTELLAVVEKDQDFETQDLLVTLGQSLPSYMVPKDIISIDAFPKNSSNKIDRKALIDILKDKAE